MINIYDIIKCLIKFLNWEMENYGIIFHYDEYLLYNKISSKISELEDGKL